MPRRAPSTFADYLVVAISPALIMLLVGSLMFFLIEVFYQGQYGMRLWFIMAMFVMAIVCVARISMEEGTGYAALFGAPLALVSLLALSRFVQISGPLAPFSLLINAGLMALVWWAAHKLTWDCTLIDDTQDASGQGLLQEMGFDPGGGAASGPAGTSSPNPSPPTPLPQGARGGMMPAPSPLSPRGRGIGEGAAVDATSGMSPRAEQPWWQRWLEADRRPHAPGLWVVYFSLAALPLFGIGGWFIPSSAGDARQRAMLFLVVYVASGLTLLLSTSFLGLRRYLRQRRLEMPIEMAATWVGLGLAMIVAMLGLCYLLPRPDSLARLADLPITFTSPDRNANRIAAGPEGAKQNPGKQSTSAAAPENGQKGEQRGAKGEAQGKNDAGGKGESAGKGKSESKGESADKTGSGAKASGKQEQNGSAGSGKGSSETKSGESKGDKSENGSGKGNSGEKNSDSKSGNSKSGNGKGESGSEKGGSQGKSESPKSEQNSSSQSAASQTPPPPPPQQPPPPPRLPNVNIQWGGILPWLLRLLFFAALAIAAIWLAWRYRAEILVAWHKLLQELRELWDKLFGGRRAAQEAAAAAAVPAIVHKPFASFADPFATGAAARMSWPELVRYTFTALEAWGREQGCPRAAGQTPHEFAAAVSQIVPQVGRLAPSLADAYGQIAYAPERPSAAVAEPLRQLWQQMRSAAQPAVVS